MTLHTITLANRDGAAYRVVPFRRPLDSLRDQGADLPNAGRYGGCITYAAKPVSGEVDQRRQNRIWKSDLLASRSTEGI